MGKYPIIRSGVEVSVDGSSLLIANPYARRGGEDYGIARSDRLVDELGRRWVPW